MEELGTKIFNSIFSENWIIWMLFCLTLFWIYRISYFWVKRYLDLIEEKHKIERIAQDNKDLSFLKTVWEISKVIKNWDDEHIKAHNQIWKIIENNHNNISNKIERNHNEIKDLFYKK